LTRWQKKKKKEAWTRKYSKHGDLVARIRSETSFNFRSTLMHALQGTRMPPGMVDVARAEADADALYRAGEKRLGTDDSTFIEIISRSSAEHLQQVSAVYARKHGHPLEKAIESETSGSFRKTLLAFCTPRPKYVAVRIHDAIHGIGTNDSLLIRMVAFNEKPILAAAAAVYLEMYKHKLADDLKGDTSGNYQRLILRLLRL
jgi:annexin A7/11